jgi:signal transduction histidine kinase
MTKAVRQLAPSTMAIATRSLHPVAPSLRSHAAAPLRRSRYSSLNEPVESHFGIGLSIARRNVEAMGGTIAAENRIPHGLAVHVRLPLAPGGD